MSFFNTQHAETADGYDAYTLLLACYNLRMSASSSSHKEVQHAYEPFQVLRKQSTGTGGLQTTR